MDLTIIGIQGEELGWIDREGKAYHQQMWGEYLETAIEDSLLRNFSKLLAETTVTAGIGHIRRTSVTVSIYGSS